MIGTGNHLKGLHQYDRMLVRQHSQVETGSDSLVQQHDGPETDINNIVRRFGITQTMPLGVAGGVYGDFSGITDFADAVALVDRAMDQFMALPADVRERFKNDPAVMIDTVQNMSREEFEAFASPPAPPPAEPTVASMTAKEFVSALKSVQEPVKPGA